MAMPVGNTCTLVLYHQDQRAGNRERDNSTEISLSKQTAARANELICEFFDVTAPWDKKLFEAAFSSDIEFDLFEFGRTDSPDVVQGIEISGDRNIVFSNPLEKFEALDRGARKVHVTFQSRVHGKNEYDLTLEDLRGESKGDLAIVALYNSESFSRHNQGSTNLDLARLVKID